MNGYDQVTEALRVLVNSYPGLAPGETFSFSELDVANGKAIFPTTGGVVQSEIESITGHVTQMCLYPFTIVFRSSGLSQSRKVSAKEWLDTMGRWLERQTVLINNTEYQLESYPELTGDREIRAISRQTPAYLNDTGEDKSESWVISMVIRYRNEYDK